MIAMVLFNSELAAYDFTNGICLQGATEANLFATTGGR